MLYLKSLYNIILLTGEFPDNWSKAILTPIHKKGNQQDPTNYWGIALTDVIGKIFTKILNERLVSWADLKKHSVDIDTRGQPWTIYLV